MADEKFRLPVSSYGELVKIIQAYGTAIPGKALSLDDVAKVAAIGRTAISGNNAFLITIGIVEGGNAKSITDSGRQLARALDFNIPSEVQEQWSKIVESNEFFQKIVSAIRIRKGMDMPTLQSHIAYTAGGQKNSSTTTGTITIIQILLVAGVVIERDGKVVLNPSRIGTSPQNSSDISSSEQVKTTEQNTRYTTSDTVAIDRNVLLYRGGSRTTINIQVEILCKVDEIDELGDKLLDLISKLESREDVIKDNEIE